MLVTFFDDRPEDAAVCALATRAGAERLCGIGRELYIDFAGGVGQSKLSAALIERTIRQPGTARNWNTLRGMLERV